MSNSEQELFEEQVSHMTRLADQDILSILAMTPEEHKELHRAIRSSNALANIMRLHDMDNNNR